MTSSSAEFFVSMLAKYLMLLFFIALKKILEYLDLQFKTEQDNTNFGKAIFKWIIEDTF